MTAPLAVRRAARDDAPELLALIEALAHYEKLEPPDEGAKSRLIRDLFAERPRIESLVCEAGGRLIGYTLFFETYSSFLALPTLYLEDLFVLPEYRSRKAGSALFRAMLRETRARGCGRMEWTVLTWNRLAIDFYDRYGAKRLDDWYGYRLTAPEIDALLDQKPSQT